VHKNRDWNRIDRQVPYRLGRSRHIGGIFGLRGLVLRFVRVLGVRLKIDLLNPGCGTGQQIFGFREAAG
jgi:hypothetical protein